MLNESIELCMNFAVMMKYTSTLTCFFQLWHIYVESSVQNQNLGPIIFMNTVMFCLHLNLPAPSKERKKKNRHTHARSIPCWNLHLWLSSPSRSCWAAGCRYRRILQKRDRGWRTWGGSHGSFHWLWTQKIQILKYRGDSSNLTKPK